MTRRGQIVNQPIKKSSKEGETGVQALISRQADRIIMSTGFSSTTNKEAEAAINRQRTLMALLALLLGCMVENGVVEIEI